MTPLCRPRARANQSPEYPTPTFDSRPSVANEPHLPACAVVGMAMGSIAFIKRSIECNEDASPEAIELVAHFMTAGLQTRFGKRLTLIRIEGRTGVWRVEGDPSTSPLTQL